MTTLTIAFIILAVFAVMFWTIIAFHSISLKAVEPEHAVPENIPPEDDLEEPTYLRRSYKAYRKAWFTGDQRADEVSCNRLVSYNEYKEWFHNQPLPF